MKKIFAFILATIMVLSLVPASVFAAISKDEPCPETHTLANCDASVVKTVDPVCGKSNGYTIFKCNKCDTQFVGNIIDADEHVLVLDRDHEDTELPACTEGKAGYGVFFCELCDAKVEREIPVNELHELVHVDGVGCEAKYHCSVCDGYYNAEGGKVGEHADWEFDVVIKEPTAKAKGLARFVCDACGATKEVEIDVKCECEDLESDVDFYHAVQAGLLKIKTKAVKPTCTKDGKWAIYTCTECGKFYRWMTSDALKCTDAPKVEKDDNGVVTKVTNGTFGKSGETQKYKVLGSNKTSKFSGKNENEPTSYKIAKLNHKYDESKTVTKQGCVSYQVKYCTTCKTNVTVGEIHDWYELTNKAATCESHKIVYKVCQVCGENKNDVSDPLGHDVVTYTYPSTCGAYGYTITFCKRGNKCEKYDATLKAVEYAGGKFDKAAPIKYMDITTGKIYPDVRYDNGKGTKSAYVVLNIEPLTELKGTHNMKVIDTVVTDGTSVSCTGGYINVEECTVCGKINYTPVAAKNHELVKDTTKSTDATCNSNGLLVMACKNCDYELITVLPAITKHESKVARVEYKCALSNTVSYTTEWYVNGVPSGDQLWIRDAIGSNNVLAKLDNGTVVTYIANAGTVGGVAWAQVSYNGIIGYAKSEYLASRQVGSVSTDSYFEWSLAEKGDGQLYRGKEYYACKYCGIDMGYSYIDRVATTSPRTWFTSLEDAYTYHGGQANLTQLSYVAATCIADGYASFKCNVCTKSIYVVLEKSGHVPTRGIDGNYKVNTGIKATCTTTGIADYYLCQFCHAYLVAGEKADTFVAVSYSDLITNPHTDTLKEVVIKACDGSETFKYYVCTASKCGKMFADAKATQEITEVPKEGIHTGLKVLVKGITTTCNTDGYPEVTYCSTCKKLSFDQSYEWFDADGDRAIITDNVELFENVLEANLYNYLTITNGKYTVASSYKMDKYSHGEDKNGDPNKYGSLMDHDAYSSEYDCDDTYGYQGHICTLCGHEYIDNFHSATGGHYNIYGEKLEESCANYVAVKDRTCVNCDKVIGDAEELHNKSELSEIPATCVSEGYNFVYCMNEGCTWYKVTNATPAITDKAELKAFHADKDNLKTMGPVADYATVGNSYDQCKYCGQKFNISKDVTLKDAGVEINMSTEFDSYMPNSYINIVISLDSLKGVDVWGLSFSVKYNPKVVEFVGADFADLFNAKNSANAVSGVEYIRNTDFATNPAPFIPNPKGTVVPYGIVTVASNNGNSATKIVGENEYVVLTFKVIDGDSQAVFELGDVCSDLPYQAYSVKVAATNGTEIKSNYNGNKELWINLATYLDLDEDGELTIMDAFELYYLIINDDYSVLADADHDGDVDSDDLDLLYSVLVGETTLEEILNPKETEATGDLNGDGIIGEGETDEEGRAPGTNNDKAHPSLPSSPDYQG